jgi:NifB/MoaA-like Fe-S oxidoreductase
LGTTWLYPSDELYLMAGAPIPESGFYDDPAQLENGVGLVRGLLDDWGRVRGRLGQMSLAPARITWVCGRLISPILCHIASQLEGATPLEIQIVPVTNGLFGPRVTVSGLLTGEDLLQTLSHRDLGDHVFVPRSMFDADCAVTLDDLSLGALSSALGAPVSPVDRVSDVVGLLEAAEVC